MLLHACRWCIKVNAEVLVTSSCGVPRHLVLLSGYQHSVMGDHVSQVRVCCWQSYLCGVTWCGRDQVCTQPCVLRRSSAVN